MTTQTEALKLALEALEKLTNAAEGFSVSGVYFNEELWARKCLDDAYDAMGFAQEALSQEKALQALHDENERLGLYKDAYAQPAVSETHKQKPVAWLQIGVGPLHEGDVIARTTKPKEWNSEWWKFEPLYTTPPQRTWVYLTNQEHEEIAIEWGCLSADWVFYAAAVERKVKEKNT